MNFIFKAIEKWHLMLFVVEVGVGEFILSLAGVAQPPMCHRVS